jgi:hypothetical protein
MVQLSPEERAILLTYAQAIRTRSSRGTSASPRQSRACDLTAYSGKSMSRIGPRPPFGRWRSSARSSSSSRPALARGRAPQRKEQGLGLVAGTVDCESASPKS